MVAASAEIYSFGHTHSLHDARPMTHRGLVRTLELAVVPRHNSIGADPHAGALRPALVDERADLVGDLTEVPGVDRLADGHDLVVLAHHGAADRKSVV